MRRNLFTGWMLLIAASLQAQQLKFGINAGASGGWGPVKFKVDVSYKRSSSTGIKVEKEYSLAVKVRATNDEMPAGLEKVLGMLGSTN